MFHYKTWIERCRSSKSAQVAKDVGIAAFKAAAQSTGMRKVSTSKTSSSKRQKPSAIVPKLMKNYVFFKLTNTEITGALDKHRENIHAFINAKNAELELFATIELESNNKLEIIIERGITEEAWNLQRDTKPRFKCMADLRYGNPSAMKKLSSSKDDNSE